MKDYSVLDELISKTRELHRAIFDKGYEQAKKDILEERPKTGKWIDKADDIDDQFGRHTYKCSECGKHAEYFVSGTELWWDRIKPNFCPNCGIKMVEPQKSDAKEFEQPVVKGKSKRCSTCKYYGIFSLEEPCKSCGNCRDEDGKSKGIYVDMYEEEI